MMRADVEALLRQTLSERECNIVRWRYGLSDGRIRTLDEIGKGICVTRERVRQIEIRALQKLRSPAAGGRLREYLDCGGFAADYSSECGV